MSNENETPSKEQAATDDSFETTSIIITEAEAIRLTASMMGGAS